MSAPTARESLRPTIPELREMAQLAFPIVLVNVGTQTMGVIDTAMLGRVSAADLAAGALGHFYFFVTAIVGLGVLMSLDPVISQAVGAKDESAIARGVQRGFLIALLVSVAVSAAFLLGGPVLGALDQPADVTPRAVQNVLWSIPGLLPFFVFAMMRQVLQAFQRTRAIVFAVIVGNIMNVFFNWVLIYGNLGFKAGGAVGSAQATSLARWAMMFTLLAIAWPTLKPYLRPWLRESWDLQPLGRMLALGLPVGLQFFAEANAFGLVTVMTGWMGTTTLAGHEIALSLASLTFMVPMGVAAAASVMVGHAIGAGDMAESRRDAVAALSVGVGFMAVMGVVFWMVPGTLAGLYTNDGATMLMAASLIPIAGVFQVFDGTQVVCTSILRGAGDTRAAMILHILSFWAVGIPLGALLAFRFAGGAPALWWGLTAGLAAAAVLQLLRVRAKLSRDVARVRIDRPAESLST